MATIEEYYKDFEKLQERFHEYMHDYPLFQEIIDEIYDNDIEEINELLHKNDEYYLKKAISKLEDVNNYIKKTSMEIDKLYREYDSYAKYWNEIGPLNTSEDVLDDLNNRLKKANNLINSHNLKDIKEANKIMDTLIKEAKRYQV